MPSLTESVAATAPGLLVGATDRCTHPADLDVVRVGGTKHPQVAETRCVSGRHLTWYGPSLVEARAGLIAQLGR